MIIVPENYGLRVMKVSEAPLFSEWEKIERAYPWSENQFLETLRSPVQQTLVWEEDHQIVGFGVLQVIEEESYLFNIMIKPEFRRQGKGLALLEKLTAWIKACGANRFFLDVDPANESARKLYEKFGFQVSGRRPQAYPRGEESILMRKDL